MSARRDCVEVLTAPATEYEAREEVMAAERAKERRAFHSRLAQLRAAEEARWLKRIRTSTVVASAPVEVPEPLADPPSPPTPPEPSEPMRADSDPAEPEPSASPGTPRSDPTRGLAPPPARSGLGDPPTPELYLRGARCLLDTDRNRHNQNLKIGKRSGTAQRSELGALALLIVDGDALAARIEAELKHRGLPMTAACEGASLRPVVVLLRTLVGPAARTGRDSDRYGRGLARLVRELEVRAGLPRSR